MKPSTLKRLSSRGCLNIEEFVDSTTSNLKFICTICKEGTFTVSNSHLLQHSTLCKKCVKARTKYILQEKCKAYLRRVGCLNTEEYIGNLITNLVFPCRLCSNTYTSNKDKHPKCSRLCTSCLRKRHGVVLKSKSIIKLEKSGCLNPTEYIGAATANMNFACSTCSTTYTTSMTRIPYRSTLCKVCMESINSKFNKYLDKPTTLYYVKVNNLYKIGITTRSIPQRFCNDTKRTITLIDSLAFDTGKEAYIVEQQLLSRYKKYKYYGKNILKSGNSELFNIDVLSGGFNEYRK